MPVREYRDWEPLILLCAFADFVALLVLIGAGLVYIGLPTGLPIPWGLGLLYGLVLYSFFYYRCGRQDEFLQLLITAAESQAPLAPVLRAYLEDRPQGIMREFWVVMMFILVLPFYWPFYWTWYRQRNFDRKVEAVAFLLEDGESLPDALQRVPGVASREMVWAAVLGQATGKLAQCLRSAAQTRLANVWLEILPRLFYPLLLLFVILGITGFWMVFLLPKMRAIFLESDGKLPVLTSLLADSVPFLVVGTYLAFSAIVGLVLLLLFSSTVRWYCPGVGRLYRMHVQGRVLKMLGMLLDAGKPVPKALNMLVESAYFTPTVENRLQASCRLVEQGEPLADSLRRVRLLPATMAPLVQAAERAHNLPWALTELGESLTSRTVRLMRRISLLIFPTLVFAIGLLVGFIVIGMFMPLVDLMGRLSQ